MKINNKAFTLAEVLVAIVVGVISVAAAFSAYNYYSKSYTSVSQKANVSKVARDALALIAKDLRNAGYIDPNYVPTTATDRRQAELKMIGVRQRDRNYYGRYKQSDQLDIWYTISAYELKRVQYLLWEYKNEKNHYYLARDVVLRKKNSETHPVDIELLVPYVEDFQIILKDKDGKVLVPVCYYCGPVEQSQKSGTLVATSVGQKNIGQDNMTKVHTADIYLTVRSPKEVFKKSRKMIIQNGAGTGHGSYINVPADKYYRETFFASVHTRNLATPKVQTTSAVGSLGVGQGYNK